MSYFSEQYIRYCDDITNHGPDPDDDRFPEPLPPLFKAEPPCIECGQTDGDHTGDCLAIN